MTEHEDGLLAEFDDPQALRAAARAAREQGFAQLDAHSPIPIDGLADDLGQPPTRLPALVFIAGAVGALLGFGVQYFSAVVAYPLDIGGRPYDSWPDFVPVSFEVAVLFAALTAVIAMLALNGLPRLRHAVFTVPDFARASQDRYFLFVGAHDPRFDRKRTRDFLAGLHPLAIFDVEHERAPR